MTKEILCRQLRKDELDKIHGTCRIGEIHATRKQLAKILGKPRKTKVRPHMTKTLFEWDLAIKTKTGKEFIATIHDWKSWENGIKPENITDWTLGGNRKSAKRTANLLEELLSADSRISVWRNG
jgi:hypothetical protein